jgi:hypothetical protein
MCRCDHPFTAKTNFTIPELNQFRWIVHPAKSHIYFQAQEALRAMKREADYVGVLKSKGLFRPPR